MGRCFRFRKQKTEVLVNAVKYHVGALVPGGGVAVQVIEKLTAEEVRPER